MLKQIIRSIIDKLYPTLLYSQLSFSQDGEDILLSAFYETRKNYKGFYIDIGAHHPFRFSNTAYFYRRGWKGINVEPTPHLFNAFIRKRKRDININLGVSDLETSLTFYEFDEPALNSFDRDLSLERSKNTDYNIVSEKTIPVTTLENILSKHLPENQVIDFLTIDVEGLDLQVLKSSNWQKYRPKYILVEGLADFANLNRSSTYSFLDSKDYKLVGRTLRTFVFEDGKA